MKFELMDTYRQQAIIKVIGVGGGGGNAVDHMLNANIDGVEFIVANTDAQAIKKSTARTVLQLGANLTKGLGAGADPAIGRQAAVEDRERIAEILAGADMVFITAGMGGGTGTGAAPVVAQVARDNGILTVAVVTKPFPFEGKKRMAIADQGIKELSEYVDSIITIPNEKLLSVVGKGASLLDAFSQANAVLQGAVQGIAELITRPGLINVDFADVRTVMSEMGMAMMGTASASGERRAQDAARAAVASPLLDDINISGARGILVNITAGRDLSIGEFEEVGNTVKEFAAEDATVVIGTVIEPEMHGEMRVTVVATGLGMGQKRQQPYKVIKTGTGTTDYEQLDTPTVIRNRRSEARAAAPAPEGGIEYLDIPAFLRKQAD
jgi:cell division protein FtsZ